jgi:hypothetical protein
MHALAIGDLTIRPLPAGDGEQHALAAYVGDDAKPAGVARLVRDPSDRRRAEIVSTGIAAALVDLLAADARAIGITTLVRRDDAESAARPTTQLAPVGTLARPCTLERSEHEAA